MNRKSKALAKSAPARFMEKSEQTRRNALDRKEDKRIVKKWAMDYSTLTPAQIAILDRHMGLLCASNEEISPSPSS